MDTNNASTRTIFRQRLAKCELLGAPQLYTPEPWGPADKRIASTEVANNSTENNLTEPMIETTPLKPTRLNPMIETTPLKTTRLNQWLRQRNWKHHNSKWIVWNHDCTDTKYQLRTPDASTTFRNQCCHFLVLRSVSNLCAQSIAFIVDCVRYGVEGNPQGWFCWTHNCLQGQRKRKLVDFCAPCATPSRTE